MSELTASEIQTLIDSGFSIEAIAFEFGTDIGAIKEILGQNSNEIADENNGNTTVSKSINDLIKEYEQKQTRQKVNPDRRVLSFMDQMRENYFKLVNGEELEHIEPEETLGDEDKRVLYNFINELEANYKSNNRDRQIELLRTFNKVVWILPLTYEQTSKFNSMIVSPEFETWINSNEDYKSTQNARTRIKRQVERRIIQCIKARYRITNDMQELDALYSKTAATGREMHDKMGVDDLLSKIFAKKSKLSSIEINNRLRSIPEELQNVVNSFVNGEINLDELNAAIDDNIASQKNVEAKTTLPYYPKPSDPRKTLLHKIRSFISSEKCQMRNNPDTITRLQELFNSQESAISIMVDHLIACNKYEDARHFLEQYRDYSKYDFSTSFINKLDNRIRCAQIGNATVLTIKMNNRRQDKAFTKTLLNFLSDNNTVTKSEIPLGRGNDGRDINLLNVWPENVRKKPKTKITL